MFYRYSNYHSSMKNENKDWHSLYGTGLWAKLGSFEGSVSSSVCHHKVSVVILRREILRINSI